MRRIFSAASRFFTHKFRRFHSKNGVFRTLFLRLHLRHARLKERIPGPFCAPFRFRAAPGLFKPPAPSAATPIGPFLRFLENPPPDGPLLRPILKKYQITARSTFDDEACPLPIILLGRSIVLLSLIDEVARRRRQDSARRTAFLHSASNLTNSAKMAPFSMMWSVVARRQVRLWLQHS